jgi:hypothetical protein
VGGGEAIVVTIINLMAWRRGCAALAALVRRLCESFRRRFALDDLVRRAAFGKAAAEPPHSIVGWAA